ncbi:MAG: alpha/beta hydrolase family protein [Stenotrophobium sp.]
MRYLKRLSMLVLLLAATSANAEIPLQDFLRSGAFDDVKISPDGTYLSMRVFVDNQVDLAVMDTATHKFVTRIIAGHDINDINVYRYWWASPKRLVFSVFQSFGSLAQPYDTGELVGIDADGKHGSYLFGYHGGTVTGSMIQRAGGEKASAHLIRTLPHDPQHVLISIQAWQRDNSRGRMTAFRLDVDSGQYDDPITSPLFGDTHFAADKDGFVRYAVGTDDHQNTLTYVRTPVHPEWTLLNQGELLKAAVRPLGFFKDDTSVYLSSNEGGDRQCLVQQNLTDGKRVKLSCDNAADLKELVTANDGDVPAAALYESGAPTLQLLDSNSPASKWLVDLEKSYPGELAIPVSYTRDNRLVVVHVYSDRDPGNYDLLDTQTQKRLLRIAARGWIDPGQMAERRPISFAARDGRTIYGYLTIPPGHELKALPLVVNPHGGPFWIRDGWAWEMEPQMLASRGYAVLQVNFRGSGGYGRSFLNAGRQSWDHVMIDDITDGARWAIAQGYADPKRLCIYGASYGGYAALMSAVREPDLYRCVIVYAGVTDLQRLKHDSDTGETIRGRIYIDDFIGTTDQRLHDASPLSYIDRLKAAIMIVHGRADRRVPISQAEELRGALDQRHYPYVWVAKLDEGHGFYLPADRQELYEKLLDFLDRNIGSTTQTSPSAGTPKPSAP